VVNTFHASTAQAIKLWIVSTVGLSRDALHIYVGLIAFLGVAMAFRKPLRSWFPLLAVIALSLLGEIVDMYDDVTSLGFWRWWASVHDIRNTIFWPMVLWLIARYGKIFWHNKETKKGSKWN